MSGPIVRSGPSIKFSSNWDKVFGRKKTASAPKATVKVATKATAKVTAKAKKKTAKKKK